MKELLASFDREPKEAYNIINVPIRLYIMLLEILLIKRTKKSN